MSTISDTRRLHHIWIGPFKAPTSWMDSWKKLGWEYKTLVLKITLFF